MKIKTIYTLFLLCPALFAQAQLYAPEIKVENIADGKVGIGTAIVDTKLHVKDDNELVLKVESSAASSQLLLENTSQGGNQWHGGAGRNPKTNQQNTGNKNREKRQKGKQGERHAVNQVKVVVLMISAKDRKIFLFRWQEFQFHKNRPVVRSNRISYDFCRQLFPPIGGPVHYIIYLFGRFF